MLRLHQGPAWRKKPLRALEARRRTAQRSRQQASQHRAAGPRAGGNPTKSLKNIIKQTPFLLQVVVNTADTPTISNPPFEITHAFAPPQKQISPSHTSQIQTTQSLHRSLTAPEISSPRLPFAHPHSRKGSALNPAAGLAHLYLFKADVPLLLLSVCFPRILLNFLLLTLKLHCLPCTACFETCSYHVCSPIYCVIRSDIDYVASFLRLDLLNIATALYNKNLTTQLSNLTTQTPTTTTTTTPTTTNHVPPPRNPCPRHRAPHTHPALQLQHLVPIPRHRPRVARRAPWYVPHHPQLRRPTY